MTAFRKGCFYAFFLLKPPIAAQPWQAGGKRLRFFPPAGIIGLGIFPIWKFARRWVAVAAYQDLVKKYAKRKKDTLMDSVTAGLSYADNLAVDLGLLDESGMIDAVSAAAPFAIIAVTEQMKVIMGRKTGKAGFSDAVQRMVKTGAAMGVGALASLAGGPAAAVPAAIGTRALLSHYKSKSLLGVRVQERTSRLRALRQQRENHPAAVPSRPALPAGMEYLDE